MMFTQNYVIEPAKLGFRVGQEFTVTCVGGGGAGGSCFMLNKKGGNAGYSGEYYNNYNQYYGGGGGGGGFGAGGGGCGGNLSSFRNGNYFYNNVSGAGGGSGHVVQKTFILENLLPIAITVGQRGVARLTATECNGTNGGTSSFGSIATALGGIGGQGQNNTPLESSGRTNGGVGRFNGEYGDGNKAGNGAGGYIHHAMSVIMLANPNFNMRQALNNSQSPSYGNNVDFFKGGKGGSWLAGVMNYGNYNSNMQYGIGPLQGTTYPIPGLAGQGVVILEW